MNGFADLDSDDSDFVEVDPTGRYGRYNEILGKGASKIVYRAFDEYEGIEVAWNQVKLNDFMQIPEDLERLYCEIHLLKTLKHKNIMRFCTSWVDSANRNINFVTEMFTSGTLRQYRLKHKRVNIRAIKHWCRQILQGLLYLHSHDPPVIHRDLKCDNIFINGNQGEVKIGDLGLAAVLRKSHAARCVGTPEFMAPEVYEEEYNQLVDIYSFGMCILEMVTFDYPYSECSHPAQIYKKVTSGKKPDALYRVEDPEVRRFVDKCLATVSDRLSAWELLNDPFLQIDDYIYDLRPSPYQRDYDDLGPVLTQRLLSTHHSTNSSVVNGYSNILGYEHDHEDCHSVDYEANELDLFNSRDDEEENGGIMIKGRRAEDDSIFLRLRIADKEGPIRNIYFPFDIENDTAISVATEMVAELDITDQDVTKIAEMIDGEIASLVPEWRTPVHRNNSCCYLQDLECTKHGCGSVHGRFEEIKEPIERVEHVDSDPIQPNGEYYDHEVKNEDDEDNDENTPTTDDYSNVIEDYENGITQEDDEDNDENTPNTDDYSNVIENYENGITQELRWLKAKYEMRLRGLRDQQLGVVPRPTNLESSQMLGHSLHRASSLPVDATDV